jgi:tetratricopeptide (TPR) repeat protein
MQVAEWLRGLALEQYAPAFEQNHIRGELLAELTADDLKELGVASVGHRRQLLAAIAALRAEAGSGPELRREGAAIKPEAERRQVTVMFCDLVGSTELSSRLDPEDLRELVGRYHAWVAETVTRFDGFVAKYMGDGVLAYFGYPHAHEDDAEQALRAGLALIDGIGELQAPDVALIADLHLLPSADLAPPLDVTPQRKKEETFEAWLRQVEGLCRQQPVLMVFEDIHWIDPSSRELADRTIERIANWPVLLVGTFRPEFQPTWTERPHVTMLVLTRLDRHDTAAMVANIAGNVALPREIVQEITERTDGVPLFVEELTNAVLESGAQTALSSVPHPAVSVPATLHASLMARLDRLGPAASDVAQTGAAIGREFGHELLASVADLPEPQLREALDRLANSGLLFVRGTPPHASYIFKHALVQDAAYGTMLRSRRQQLHARIAANLEDRFPEVVLTQPALLAQHCEKAGQTERAVEYWLKAGQHALARSAMTEAETLLRRGLSLAADLPDGARQEHELELLIALASVLTAVQGPGAPAAFEANARARQLCGELNRPERLLPILSGLWLYHMVRNALDRAQQLVDEMRWRGELRDDVAMLYTACRASGMVCFFRGDFETARAELERALSLYEPRRRASLAVAISSVDPLVDVLSVLATTLTCCGFLDQARLRCEAAVAEARRLAHAHSLGFALFWACLVCRLPRLHSRARECADELFAVSEDHGFPFFRAAGLAYRGWCMATSDRIGDGIPLLTAGLPDLRARAAEAFVDVWVLPMLADAHLAAGQPLVALEYLSEAERSAEATQARASLAETFRLRGESMLVTGHCGTAENSFRDALALAERQGAKLFELRAATSLARLRRDQGQRAEARDLLVPVYAWFTEGFDAPDLVDAKTLIDQLG